MPVGDFAFEVNWDGFRAVISTEDGFALRSGLADGAPRDPRRVPVFDVLALEGERTTNLP
jgi:hypothetical protein